MLSLIAKQVSCRTSACFPRSAALLSISCLNSGGGSNKRSYYHESIFQLPQFKTAFERANINNSYKSVIEQSLSKPDSKLFTEDIRSFLITARNDPDLDLLIKAIEKYNEQESSALFGFKFDVPLMKLFYTLNKVDRALEIALQDNQKVFNYSTNSLSILMNKLVEDRRYDDAIKLYHKAKASIPAGQTLRENFTDLYLEALLQKNTPDALKAAKECVGTLDRSKTTFETKLRKIFLLALNQNDATYAYELIPLLNKTSPRTVHNFKVMALSRLNRMDEAIACEQVLQRDVPFSGGNKIYFQETVDELKKAAERPENAKHSERIHEIIKNSEGKTANMDLKSYLVGVREPRPQQDNNSNRMPLRDGGYGNNRQRDNRDYQSDRRQGGDDGRGQQQRPTPYRKRDNNDSYYSDNSRPSNDRMMNRRDRDTNGGGGYNQNDQRDYQQRSRNRSTNEGGRNNYSDRGESDYNNSNNRYNRADRDEFQYLRKKFTF